MLQMYICIYAEYRSIRSCLWTIPYQPCSQSSNKSRGHSAERICWKTLRMPLKIIINIYSFRETSCGRVRGRRKISRGDFDYFFNTYLLEKLIRRCNNFIF